MQETCQVSSPNVDANAKAADVWEATATDASIHIGSFLK